MYTMWFSTLDWNSLNFVSTVTVNRVKDIFFSNQPQIGDTFCDIAT